MKLETWSDLKFLRNIENSEDHFTLDLLAMNIKEKEGQHVVLFLAFTNSNALAIFNVFHLPTGS